MTRLPENKGISLIKEEKYKEAISFYNEQVQKNPNYTVGWYNIGTALAFLGGDDNKKKALECLDKALSLRDDFPTAWYRKGSILADMENKESKEEAVKCFNKVAGLLFNPHNLKTYELPPSWESKMVALYEKGITLFELYKNTKERFEEIITCLNEAQSLSRDDTTASIILTTKGIILYEMKDYEKALISYKAALDCYKDIFEKNSDYAKPYIGKIENNMGLAFYKFGNFKEALKSYDEAIFMLKDSKDLFDKLFLCGTWSNIGILFYSADRYNEALECYKKAEKEGIEGGGLHGVPWANKGLLLYKMNRIQEAFDAAAGKGVPVYGLEYLYSKQSVYFASSGYEKLKSYTFLSDELSDEFIIKEYGESRPIFFSSILMKPYKSPICTHLEEINPITYLKVDPNLKEIPSVIVPPKGKRDVFLCHCSEDKIKYVVPIKGILDREHISYWYDEAEIKWGESLLSKIHEGLKISKYVIVFLSKNFINKRWAKHELESAMTKEIDEERLIVLPLLIGSEEEIKNILTDFGFIRNKKYIKFSDGFDIILFELKDVLDK